MDYFIDKLNEVVNQRDKRIEFLENIIVLMDMIFN